MSFGFEGVGATVSIGSSVLKLRSVGSLGLNGGAKLDISTLSNTTYKTAIAQTLIDSDDISFTAAFDPSSWALIVAEINVNQAITISIPSFGDFVFWGFLQSYIPGEGAIGAIWDASGVISVTHWDGSDETAPIYTAE